MNIKDVGVQQEALDWFSTLSDEKRFLIEERMKEIAENIGSTPAALASREEFEKFGREFSLTTHEMELCAAAMFAKWHQDEKYHNDMLRATRNKMMDHIRLLPDDEMHAELMRMASERGGEREMADLVVLMEERVSRMKDGNAREAAITLATNGTAYKSMSNVDKIGALLKAEKFNADLEERFPGDDKAAREWLVDQLARIAYQPVDEAIKPPKPWAFDCLCYFCEQVKDTPKQLRDMVKEARLFDIDEAMEFTKRETRTDLSDFVSSPKLASLLSNVSSSNYNTFTLPFPVVAVEHKMLCGVYQVLQRGPTMIQVRFLHWSADHKAVFGVMTVHGSLAFVPDTQKDDNEKSRFYYDSLSVWEYQDGKGFGPRVNLLREMDNYTVAHDKGRMNSAAYGQALAYHEHIKQMASFQVSMDLAMMHAINNIETFVLETTPVRLIGKRANRTYPRKDDRALYTMLKAHVIRKQMGLPEPEDEIITDEDGKQRIKRRPHERRGHWRHLRAERYKVKKPIWIKNTWIGPRENTVGGKRYKVLLDELKFHEVDVDLVEVEDVECEEQKGDACC